MGKSAYERIIYDARYFLESLVSIVDKNKAVIPFIFNPVQKKFWKEMTGRDIVLKPRQLGFTTLFMGILLHETMFFPNSLAVTVAQREEDAKDLFERVLFMFNSIDEIFRPKVGKANVRELKFEKLNSKYIIGSAEAKHFGISKTINILHVTEMSHPYYKEEFIASLLEAVPPSGKIFLESTAKGEGNVFHRYYMDAKYGRNEYKAHFYRWFEHEEYRIKLDGGEVIDFDLEEIELMKRYPIWFPNTQTAAEKIKWRRQKKARLGKLFIQEYPEGEDEEAFIRSGSPVFDVDWLRKRELEIGEQKPNEIWLGGELYVYKVPKEGDVFVIGADTSEGGPKGDRSAAMVLRVKPLPVEQCALLVGKWSPDLFSEKLWKLGKAYNQALIAVERNVTGHAVLLNLHNGIVRNGVVVYPPYSPLYVGADRKLGWLTSALSKGIMIQELDRAMRSGELIVNSKRFIEEAKMFSFLGGGKLGAASMAHDDIVMATAIAMMAVVGGGFKWEFI